jgi:hypothetical protein
MARQKVTLGRSFQIVKESQPAATNTGWASQGIGSLLMGVWWWLVGVPEESMPPE